MYTNEYDGPVATAFIYYIAPVSQDMLILTQLHILTESSCMWYRLSNVSLKYDMT